MTENKGFWYYNPLNNWPPNSVSYTKALIDDERISLDITQLPIPPSQQKKLIKEWCLEIPKLKKVRYLWFHTRINQEVFESVCQIENLEGLYIRRSNVAEIESLRKLKNLKHLYFGASPKIENIDILCEMDALRTLNIVQFDKVSNFNSLSNLIGLEELGIDGSISKAQKIETLKPIERLINLEYLSFTNTILKDKSFDSILKLTKLVKLECSWNYPTTEFEKLKKLQNLKYGNIETSWKEQLDKLKEKFGH